MSTSFDPRLGQLFILQLESARWSPRLKRLLRAVQPAGVIVPLDAVRPATFLGETVKGISSTLRGTPLVGSADLHAGIIDLLGPMPGGSARPVFDSRLRRRAEAAGKFHGIMLRKIGRNVDFSLWLDLARPGPRLALGQREPDRDPHLVAKCGAAYLRGLRLNKVAACARDFPGTASAELDQEFGGLLSSKPMGALWREDLVPFRELLPALPLVMISHAAYKAYDFETPRPAVWSSEVVTGLLRLKLGYKGVAVAHVWPRSTKPEVSEGVVKALEAGCDLLIVPGDKATVECALRAVRAALDSGRIAAERIEESLQRIRAMKRKLAKPLRVTSKKALEQLSRENRARRARTRKNEESV